MLVIVAGTVHEAAKNCSVRHQFSEILNSLESRERRRIASQIRMGNTVCKGETIGDAARSFAWSVSEKSDATWNKNMQLANAEAIVVNNS